MLKSWRIPLFNFILCSASALYSCNQTPPQRPSIYKNDGFLDYSKKFNKDLKNNELKEIQDYIRNSKVDFLSTNAGIYMTRTNPNKTKTVSDFDTISFNYQISNLQDSIIYSYSENGNQKKIMGQSTIIPAMEFGLKRMSSGDNATILTPSTLGYGLSGDGKKIGADLPLKIEIRLNKINQNED